eukprot:scaffold71_cov247-Pinguiococcus_pyrenoidosus.AAC.35
MATTGRTGAFDSMNGSSAETESRVFPYSTARLREHEREGGARIGGTKKKEPAADQRTSAAACAPLHLRRGRRPHSASGAARLSPALAAPRPAPPRPRPCGPGTPWRRWPARRPASARRRQSPLGRCRGTERALPP